MKRKLGGIYTNAASIFKSEAFAYSHMTGNITDFISLFLSFVAVSVIACFGASLSSFRAKK